MLHSGNRNSNYRSEDSFSSLDEEANQSPRKAEEKSAFYRQIVQEQQLKIVGLSQRVEDLTVLSQRYKGEMVLNNQKHQERETSFKRQIETLKQTIVRLESELAGKPSMGSINQQMQRMRQLKEELLAQRQQLAERETLVLRLKQETEGALQHKHQFIKHSQAKIEEATRMLDRLSAVIAQNDELRLRNSELSKQLSLQSDRANCSTSASLHRASSASSFNSCSGAGSARSDNGKTNDRFVAVFMRMIESIYPSQHRQVFANKSYNARLKEGWRLVKGIVHSHTPL